MTKFIKPLPHWLRIQFCSNLIGEIYPEILAIALKYCRTTRAFLVRYYLDREPIEEDYSIFELPRFEIHAAYDIALFNTSDLELIFSDEPMDKLDQLDGFVFARKE
jgi:hypothetical protein